MNEIISFEIENVEILEENLDSQFAIAKVQAFSSGKNRHDMVCSEEVLKKTAPTLYNKPLLYNINNIFDDFGSHSDPSKTLIAGFVVPNSAVFERLSDGRLAVSVSIKIWKRYAPKAMGIFQRDQGKKKVSVEMELVKVEQSQDSLLEMLDFVYSGICILGDLVTEASPGANIEILSFAQEKEEYKKALLVESTTLYNGINFQVPDAIKKNMQNGISIYQKGNSKKYPVYFGNAKYILNNGKTNPDRIKSMISFLNYKNYDIVEKDKNVIYMLCGEKDGINWMRDLFNQMRMLEVEYLSNFGSILNSPYENIEDINLSLKDIVPPLTLKQANCIANQSDAIKNSYSEDSWGIAIDNFKATHIIRNGAWITKENENMEEKDNVIIEEETEEILEPNGAETTFEEGKPESEPEEEPAKEEGEEDVEQEEEVDNAVDQKYSVEEILSLFSDEAEDILEEIKTEFSKENSQINYEKAFELVFNKAKKNIEVFELKIAEYEKENQALQSFKDEVGQKQFEFIVSSTLKEIQDGVEISEGSLSEMREKSKEFTLENVDAWKNECKALAFSFAIKSKDEEPEKQKQYGFPWRKDSANENEPLWKKQ